MYSQSNFHQRISKAFKSQYFQEQIYIILENLTCEGACRYCSFLSNFIYFKSCFFSQFLPLHTSEHIVLHFRLFQYFLLDDGLKELFISRWSFQLELSVYFPYDANVAQRSRIRFMTHTGCRPVVVSKFGKQSCCWYKAEALITEALTVPVISGQDFCSTKTGHMILGP